VQRVDFVASDVLRAKPALLSVALVRRWFISAVARAMRPGCKVDSVRILVGPQGVGKSRFFATLAGAEWFSDTAFDVANKDAYMVLARSWIVEWAELESLARARDAAAVKAFLSSSMDTYRPPYGRETVDLKRSCVIVGSTNEAEFLSDSTGNRRYWTLPITGPVDISALAEHRDQLWAEARAIYESGEQWHLAAGEDETLREAHKEHEIRDAWESRVLDYAANTTDSITVPLLLERALDKPAAHWTRGDQMRVAKILEQAGYRKAGRRMVAGRRNYEWKRGEAA
jgi:putative DNA primase/helicase